MHDPLCSKSLGGLPSIENQSLFHSHYRIPSRRYNFLVWAGCLPISRISCSFGLVPISISQFLLAEKVPFLLQPTCIYMWKLIYIISIWFCVTNKWSKYLLRRSNSCMQTCMHVLWRKRKTEYENYNHQPGKSQGSYLQTLISGMIEAGNGSENTLHFKYWKTSSSSVGWKRKPGGNLVSPCRAKLNLSIDIKALLTAWSLLSTKISWSQATPCSVFIASERERWPSWGRKEIFLYGLAG